jgi:hypothetical protein
LYSQSLKRVLGANYRKTVSEAELLGYVESKGTYLAGKRCKSYRLADGVGKAVTWEECLDGVLKGNILKDRVRKSEEARLAIAPGSLDAWLWESLLDVAFRQAGDWAQSETLQCLLSGHPDYAICDYGRRHTPFTRLPSRVRSSVYFRSSPPALVMEVDIRNSQPLFLLVELNDGIRSTRTKEEDRRTQEASPMATPQPPGSTPLCGTVCGFAAFKQDVEDGMLYDRMMGELGTSDRDAFKAQFFAHVLYGKVGEWSGALPMVQAFARLYPEVWTMIVEAKKDDYRALARRMQRRESDFIYNRVLPRMMARCPTARILTVHDAVYCEERHKGELIAIMEEEFERLGVKATLRVTVLPGNQRHAEGQRDTPTGQASGASCVQTASNRAVVRRQVPASASVLPYPGRLRADWRAPRLPCSRGVFEMLLDMGIDARDYGDDWPSAVDRMLECTLPRWPRMRLN